MKRQLTRLLTALLAVILLLPVTAQAAPAWDGWTAELEAAYQTVSGLVADSVSESRDYLSAARQETNAKAVYALWASGADVPEGFYNEYLQALADWLALAEQRGRYAYIPGALRTVAAMGLDVTDLAGHDLLEPLRRPEMVEADEDRLDMLLDLDAAGDAGRTEAFDALRETLIAEALARQQDSGEFRYTSPWPAELKQKGVAAEPDRFDYILLTAKSAQALAPYCRVSSSSEDQLNSFAAQNIHYTQYITEHDDWRLVDIYADEGITGTSVEKREDFKRMLADSERGLIDRILVKSISRFARNTVDCLNYVRMLKAQGIAVYFEKENINSMDESTELMLTMMGAFAQAESESISGNIQAGKRYAMQRGEATINYHNLYAYEKGPDGKPRAIPEQAEIVREIYQKYLRGDSLNMIRKDLEERHIPNARGGVTWTHTAVRGILSNEKYAGDVLMQKTFRQDCISRKTIRNTGQRAMYLVQNNHEAIIDRKTYDAVQTELTRRNALKGNTQKSTPSGRSCYTPKYALSDRVICGECGTLYRRCTWVNRGKKHIVWRCISRFDYGKKYCHDSPAVDEQQLQQAILRVINGAMSEKPALVRQVTENLQVVIRPSRSEELTVAEIDRELEALAREFDTAFVAAASGNSEDYSERFKTILAQQAELKTKRAELEQRQAEDAELTSHMELAADTLEQAGTVITKWDEYQIRALVESVRILSKDEVLVRLKSGIEKIEKLQK